MRFVIIFFAFKQKRAEILARNPTAKVTEVVKEIAQSWGVLSKEDKQKYKDAAKKGKDFIYNTIYYFDFYVKTDMINRYIQTRRDMIKN